MFGQYFTTPRTSVRLNAARIWSSCDLSLKIIFLITNEIRPGSWRRLNVISVCIFRKNKTLLTPLETTFMIVYNEMNAHLSTEEPNSDENTISTDVTCPDSVNLSNNNTMQNKHALFTRLVLKQTHTNPRVCEILGSHECECRISPNKSRRSFQKLLLRTEASPCFGSFRRNRKMITSSSNC